MLEESSLIQIFCLYACVYIILSKTKSILILKGVVCLGVSRVKTSQSRFNGRCVKSWWLAAGRRLRGTCGSLLVLGSCVLTSAWCNNKHHSAPCCGANIDADTGTSTNARGNVIAIMWNVMNYLRYRNAVFITILIVVCKLKRNICACACAATS